MMMIIVRIEKDTKKYFIVGYTELFSMLALLFIVRSILIKLFLLCCLFFEGVDIIHSRTRLDDDIYVLVSLEDTGNITKFNNHTIQA